LKEKNVTTRNPSILWVIFTLLDLSINKAAPMDILQEFLKKGYRARLISARSSNMSQNKYLRGHLNLIPLKRIPLVLPLMFAILMLFYFPIYVLLFKPNYIIMEPNVQILTVFPTILVAKLKKSKLILDVRTIPVESVGLRGYLDKFWFFVSIVVAKKLFDGITIITPLMKQEVCNNFRLDSNKIGVWTSGVSDSLFNIESLAVKSSCLKTKLGLSEKFIVFYHGVFTSSRGLDKTIEAMALIKPKHPDIVFFLLGNGPVVEDLKALIRKEDLQRNVIIHSAVEQLEVPKFIDFCDVGIIPLPNNTYWRFQSPLKLLEYLSMKKVVVLSDIPAHRWVVDEAKCAIYFSSVTPVEIAKSIEYAYDNRDRLVSWGKVGREIIKRSYTWEKVAQNLENYLKSIG
jgi:glycosyltransferase involved in cell wall biosynthesis